MAKEKEVKLSFSERATELEKRFNIEEKERFCIPTGSIALDKALGGGFFSGRITELIAWEGSGKTTLSLHAIAEAQKLGLNVAYVDAEHSLDKKYAKAIGVDWDKLQGDEEVAGTLFQPMNGEEAFEYGKSLIETGECGLIVFDSTSGMVPKKAMEGEAGSSTLGLHSRLFSQEIPKINALASKHNTVVIFISQVREKIGVMFGSPETTQAGNALKFFASTRIDLRKSLDKEGDVVIGTNTKFKTLKNKSASPYQTGRLPIVFGVGIDKLKEVILLGKETEVLKVRAGIITFEDVKYPEDEFRNLLLDNPEFYNKIKTEITAKMDTLVEMEEV